MPVVRVVVVLVVIVDVEVGVVPGQCLDGDTSLTEPSVVMTIPFAFASLSACDVDQSPNRRRHLAQ